MIPGLRVQLKGLGLKVEVLPDLGPDLEVRQFKDPDLAAQSIINIRFPPEVPPTHRKITILKIDPHLKDLNPKDLEMLTKETEVNPDLDQERLQQNPDQGPNQDPDPNPDPQCQDVAPGLPHVTAQDLDRGQDQRLL